MESSNDFNNAKPATDTTSDTLLVNFSWKKFSTVISDSAEPTKPLYTIAYNVLGSPDMDFRSVADNKQLAHANAHVFGINPTLILHGKEMSLRASRRLKTQYSYPSTALSSNGTPTLLTYTSESSFKNWDYILLDPQLQPVARFSANIWATKKIGKIEFMGDLARNQQFREEVIVTSLTMYYTMILRSANTFNLIGAAFYGKSGRNENNPEFKPEPAAKQNGLVQQGAGGQKSDVAV